MKLICALLLTVGLTITSITTAQGQPPPLFDPARHMRVSEVKEGMKGYGLSVFKGNKIERFEVEVLSVLRNFNPKDHVVLVKLKGANLEHTGAIAGMSGSPVFLKDDQGRERMIGAFAFGWPLMKEPMGGVQPIEYMLTMKTEPTSIAAKPRALNDRTNQVPPAKQGQLRWSVEQTMPVPWKKGAPKAYPLAGWRSSQVNPLLGKANDAMRMVPLATPLMATGLPPRVFDQFEPILKGYGLLPLQTGGAGTKEAAGSVIPLHPGSAIAVPLMTGDMDLSVMGTCTEVLGDRIMGFGHSFLNEGDILLPLSSGYIHGVIPNLQTSFKLGAAATPLGVLVSDQYCGVAGKIGPTSPSVPMEIRCVYADGSVDQTFRFNLALHPRLTATLAAMALAASTTSMRDLPQYHTLDYDLAMEFANGQSLRLNNRSTSTGTAELYMLVGTPIMAAADNPFERVAVKKLTGTVRVLAEARQADILSVSLPKSKFKPGEKIRALVRYRPFLQREMPLPVEFDLPRNLPDGTYQFVVSDWQQHLVLEEATKPFRFTASTAPEVFDVMRELLQTKHNALYLRLIKQTDGIAIGRAAMEALPSSRRKVMMGAGLSNMTTFASSTLKVVPTEHVMSGEATFALTIDRELKVEGEKMPLGQAAFATPGNRAPAEANRPVPPPANPGGVGNHTGN